MTRGCRGIFSHGSIDVQWVQVISLCGVGKFEGYGCCTASASFCLRWVEVMV